jgi:hypothetical protein
MMRTEKTEAISVMVSTAGSAAPTEITRNTTAPVSLRADLDSSPRDLTPAASVLALVSLAAQAYAWRRRSPAPPRSGTSRAAVDAALRELQNESLLSGTKERSAARIAGALEAVFGPRPAWPSDDTGDRLKSLFEDLEFLRFAPQLGSYDAKLKEVRDRAMAILEALR